jgi:hypothetical protein
MSINPSAVASNVLPTKWAGASASVVSAIKRASQTTGVSFDYLMDKAKTESAFDPDIKAKTSSATGLYQFIDSTWLATLKEHGAKYGLDDLVSKIDSDPSAKKQALDLRKDPEIAAVMTAEATKDNKYYLETSVGGDIGKNELYLAHFLGLGGATKFLQAKNANPDQPAADLFPSAASANKNVFYDASGKKKSLNEVYAFFAKKMDSAGEGHSAVASSAQTPAASSSVAFLKQIHGVHGTASLSPLNPALMARLSGVSHDTDASATTHVASATAGDLLPTDLQRNFFSLAMGQAGNADKTLLGEGSLISPFTSMILAKLATLRDTVDRTAADQS